MTVDERKAAEARILRRLRALRPQIEGGEAKLNVLYAERAALFREGRDQDPPMIQRVMGEASGVSEAAVIHTVKRAERRTGSTPNG